MDAIELELQIDNTAAFIAAKSVSITLTPVIRERTPAGGFADVDQDPRDPQDFRIIELGFSTAGATHEEIKIQDGTLREVAFWMLATPDKAVGKWDHWHDDDTARDWLVADVIRSNEYEIRAVVVEYGV